MLSIENFGSVDLKKLINSEDFFDFVLTILTKFYDDYDNFVEQIGISDFGFEPIHFGALVPSTNSKVFLSPFFEEGFFLEKKFPSAIVTNQLSEKYKKEDISIDILKLVDDSDKRLELFICNHGLSIIQLLDEVKGIFHFAFQISDFQVDEEIFDKLLSVGYKIIGGGVNNSEEVTVFYLLNENTEIGPVKIELLIQGVYSNLIEEYL